MPRPGPRPYECVRRAWHSDRHQPMRGSLIQEIFRVANEVHSSATRKNKEWQEKLPIVVLKAEEIIYSKANSEGEYMDLKTLWDRANDAIDTIIRRDDTPESGDLLQPCIEAALNLGCIPRRASRSQRHNNPGIYLSSTARDTSAVAETHEIHNSSQAHLGSSSQLLSLPHSHPNSLPCPNSESPLSKDTLFSCPDGGPSIPMETFPRTDLGRIYPLFYHDNQQKLGFRPALQNPQNPISNGATTTLACIPSSGEIPTGYMQNFLAKNDSDISLNFEETFDVPSNDACDLALRLGQPSPPSIGVASSGANEVDDVGSSSSSGGRARSSSLSSRDRAFDFFRLDGTDEPLESCSSKGSSEGEGAFYLEAPGGKRGRPVDGSFGNGYICWKQRITEAPLLCRTERLDSKEW